MRMRSLNKQQNSILFQFWKGIHHLVLLLIHTIWKTECISLCLFCLYFKQSPWLRAFCSHVWTLIYSNVTRAEVLGRSPLIVSLWWCLIGDGRTYFSLVKSKKQMPVHLIFQPKFPSYRNWVRNFAYLAFLQSLLVPLLKQESYKESFGVAISSPGLNRPRVAA